LAIDWFYTRVFVKFMLDNPELLTRLRIFENAGIRGHNAKLSDSSPADTERMAAMMRENLDTLRKYDINSYQGQEKLSYRIMEHFVETLVRGEPWRYHNFPVNQLFGVQSELPNMMTQSQQINDVTDAEHYLQRLMAYPQKMDGVIASMKVREQKGIVPPKFVVEKVGTQLKDFLSAAPKDNALAVAFREKLAKIPAEKMDVATRAELTVRAELAVAEHVIPAYQKLAAANEALRPKATVNHGAWSLPEGEKYYQYAVELHTSTNMKPDELHALGLKEVARIGADMDVILRGAGFNTGTLGERILALSKTPGQTYEHTDAARDQILKDYQAIIDEISAGLDPWFHSQPKAKVEVKRVPALSEKSSAFAYYNPPAMDGSKPGVFYANLRKPDEIAKFGMRTLAYHEAIPGHHTQIATAAEIKGLPIFRKLVPFTAYGEGWALYSEQLAWEAGFQKNPLDNLGRLQAEMFRAVRLVVDTGIHAKRWTRERAIDYMLANTGMPEIEVIAEIERYFVMPGQALAYKVGMIKFLELRDKAKRELGPKFDIRDFHDVVLKSGGMPLSILEEVVGEYVRMKQG
ncbi:MAG: DUF885 domain-containing protein, partial [Betaproteobacteria bacterium]|nr:DUF885 domain-containing protein [Betaproteobacteria bacterium]